MNLEEIIQGAQGGNRIAMYTLHKKLYKNMLQLCRRYVKVEQDAEERMQDGFVKFFQKLPEFTYQSDEAFYSWIQTIMVNVCIDFIRIKSGFPVMSDISDEELVVDEQVFTKLSAETIKKVICKLPIGYRTIFNLHEVEKFNHKEIASMLEISESTSWSQLSKAKNLLQKILLKHQEYAYFRSK